jgi:hypothetical protein
MTTIYVLVALATCNNLLIHQMDVKTAILNGELDEEIYIKQPDGFVASGQENKVCRLKKSPCMTSSKHQSSGMRNSIEL